MWGTRVGKDRDPHYAPLYLRPEAIKPENAQVRSPPPLNTLRVENWWITTVGNSSEQDTVWSHTKDKLKGKEYMTYKAGRIRRGYVKRGLNNTYTSSTNSTEK